MSSQIVFIIGVSGSGKSTIGRQLVARFNEHNFRDSDTHFIEGDDHHSVANRSKMESGTPLQDSDRWPWLQSIAEEVNRLVTLQQNCVISCSALKESYREYLMDQLDGKPAWVYLHGDVHVIAERMRSREHFMPLSLLQSQMETMEAPDYALRVDINQKIDRIIEQILEYLHEK